MQAVRPFFHNLMTRCKSPLVLVLSLIACVMVTTPYLHAQATATLTGSVTDAAGALIVGAAVTATNTTTQDVRQVQTNNNGLFAFANLLPSTYTVKVVSPGFSPIEVTGIELHGGDSIKLAAIALAVGAVTDKVTIEASSQLMTTESGLRSMLLSYQDIQDLALEGRDTSELLKTLPGVVTMTSGNVPTFTFLSITTGQSAIGQGLNANGAPNRGGTTLMMDGVSVLDPGADFSSLATVNPEMTQEVNVLSTNFGADTPFGPVVINTTSKSGGATFHGSAYFNARNDVLNANDWVDNHKTPITPKGGAAYYYPGGGISGPVPKTNKKLFFYGGAELLYQNQGNANHVVGSVPTPEMLKGDFSLDNADNAAMCPNGFYNTGITGSQAWCNNVSNAGGNSQPTVFPDGTMATPSSMANPGLPTGYTTGGTIPAKYINSNMVALSNLWPAYSSPYVTKNYSQMLSQGGNYYQVIINHDNGWIYRTRLDYAMSDKTKFYIAYQQGYDRQLANGAGTNIYSTGALQFPGGGLYKTTYSKVITGHFIHIFNASTTNDLSASWVYGSIPTAPNNPSADYRSTIGFNVPTVYGGVSKFAPTYNVTTYGFIGNTQADIFEPGNYYKVLKTIPTFTDDFTKVWGNHTIKVGGFASNTDNFQGNMGTNLQGLLAVATGTTTNNYFANLSTGNACGAVCNGYQGNYGSNNSTAAFLMGNLSNYSESNSGPLQDLAYQTLAFYVNDTMKVSKKLTMEVGLRFEHIGHWYDRQGVGIADFFPQRVLPDFYAGKVNPGFYWHGIDPAVPLSGTPDRFLYVAPRLGLSYDVFGTGKTLVRGGWGAYRFAEQYNDASSALTTAQAVKQYAASAFTSGHNFLLSQIGQLVPANCQVQCATTSTQYGFDANDHGIPLTYSYNFTIDQQLPWKMLLDVAYVGNQTQKLSDTGATLTTGGQLNQSYANQNKAPLGAYFKPDPITGVTSCNPENIAGPCSPTNNAADYQPYGKVQTAGGASIYGTSGLYQSEHIGYANYNGLQGALVKRAGRVTLNINATWSKALATINNFDPFTYRNNYGYDTGQRPFIFSASYIYRAGTVYHGNKLLEGTVNGWTISGITTWQEGANTLPTVNMQYDPATVFANGSSGTVLPGVPTGAGTGVGASTYFGTNAGFTIRPVVTCNPTSGLAYHQVYKACFAPPAVGSQGGQQIPYVASAAYMDNDLAIYKTFTIHDEHKIQFRASAFNWLNHPLPNFSSTAQQTNMYYYVNYQTKAIYPNPNGGNSTVGNTSATSPVVPTFGYLDYKNGNPGQRIMEFDLKYSF
jgi:hypothetical protein